MNLYIRFGKRSLDLLLVLTTAPIWLSVLGFASLAVRLAHGSPVIFRQLRPGLQEQEFELLKFRTMTEAVEGVGRPMPDEERLTRFGRLLRRTSLDELPGLINVVRGDMSLVGPRPLLPQYLERYSAEQARRHEVKPGITGWAQVNGRNALSWERKFELDVWYVDNLSLLLDLKILGLTVWKTITGEGLSAADHATMPEFMGTPDE